MTVAWWAIIAYAVALVGPVCGAGSVTQAMNAKAKGTRNEHRSIRLLEAAGYRCTRAAASPGAWDVLGVSATDVVLVG